MSRIEEQISEQFHRWETRGRGWKLYSEPVCPEPPLVPFTGHYLPPEPMVDDGRRPTFLSSFVQKLSRKMSTEQPAPPAMSEPEEEPDPIPLVRDALAEFVASLPDKLDVSRESFEQFLLNLSMCWEPIAFELVGTYKKVVTQFAAHPEDAPLLHRQLQAFFPEAVFVPGNRLLDKAWGQTTGDEPLAVEFGLAHEFMLPLASGKIDPFIGVVGALSDLRPGELGLFQVLFQPLSDEWPESIVRSVTRVDGKPFFLNKPELAGAAEKKVARPLFAAIVRILVCTERFERSLQIARDLAGALRVFLCHPSGHLRQKELSMQPRTQAWSVSLCCSVSAYGKGAEIFAEIGRTEGTGPRRNFCLYRVSRKIGGAFPNQRRITSARRGFGCTCVSAQPFSLNFPVFKAIQSAHPLTGKIQVR